VRRALAILSFCTLSFSQTAMAQARPEAQNTKISTIAFWRFSACSAEGDTSRIRRLLAVYPWTDADAESARRLAVSRSSCLLPGDQLAFRSDNFRGGLSAALLSKKYATFQFPAYASYPFAFPSEGLTKYRGDDRRKYILLAFAECIFRTSPVKTVTLFRSEPFSKDEVVSFASLDATMSACLPLTPGEQVKFSRPTLRTLLGIAAYESDKKVAAPMLKSGVK
jgi:hypothetical protein